MAESAAITSNLNRWQFVLAVSLGAALGAILLGLGVTWSTYLMALVENTNGLHLMRVDAGLLFIWGNFSRDVLSYSLVVVPGAYVGSILGGLTTIT